MFKLTVIPLVSQLSHDFLPFLTFQTVWYQLPIKPKINESYKLENHLKSSESKIFTYPTFNPCCISYMFHICTRFVNVRTPWFWPWSHVLLQLWVPKYLVAPVARHQPLLPEIAGEPVWWFRQVHVQTSSGISTSTYKNNIFFC